MVTDPQLGPVRGIEEGCVPRAIVAIALYHKRYAVLDPGIGRQEIPAGILDQPQHIIVAPAAVAGIHDKQAIAAFDEISALVDGALAAIGRHRLPIVGCFGNHGVVPRHGGGRAHLLQRQALLAEGCLIAVIDQRKAQIQFSGPLILIHRGINTEHLRVQMPAQLKAVHRIVGLGCKAQYMLEAAVICGLMRAGIDIPSAVDKVQLRCPKRAVGLICLVRLIYHLRFAAEHAAERFAAIQQNAVVMGMRPIVAMIMRAVHNAGIGCFVAPIQRVSIAAFLRLINRHRCRVLCHVYSFSSARQHKPFTYAAGQ